MKEMVELEAAAHVADRHVVGIDHAGQLGARPRLADHAQSDQSIHLQLDWRARGDHVDGRIGARPWSWSSTPWSD